MSEITSKAVPKVQWRKKYRSQWQDWLVRPQSAHIVASLVQGLKNFLQDSQGTWGAYSALPDEVDISSLYSQVTHIRWVYPKVSAENSAQMDYYQPTHSFEKNSWGVSEPVVQEPIKQIVSGDDLQGVLVPALAFDRKGYRLGRGKGYYDNFLNKYKNTKLICVGVGPLDFIAQQLPTDAWDMPMHYLATEDGVHKVTA